MNRKWSLRMAAPLFCAACLILLGGAAAVRALTRGVFVNGLNVSNRWTSLILQEGSFSKSAPSGPEVDWEALYPFTEEISLRLDSVGVQPGQSSSGSVFTGLLGRWNGLQEHLNTYTTTRLVGYQKFLRLSAKYEGLLQWELYSADSTSNIYKLEDGHLFSALARVNAEPYAEPVILLDEFCRERDIPFLYVQIPYKICSQTDTAAPGSYDSSNANEDDLLALLDGAGVETLDLRQALHEEGLSHHGLFFRTDFHWKPETGFWAAGRILQVLQERFSLPVDPSRLSEENFRKEVYEGYFLGDYGKQVTLLQTEPDDISLFYPLFDTSLHYVVPSRGIDYSGDFSILYAPSMLARIDYYNLHAYSAYMHANYPFGTVENELADNDLHVLILQDSYGKCVVPFLLLEAARTDTIDMRYFTGSVRTYIETEQPDLVIVMNSAIMIGDKEAGAAKSIFDLR